MRVADLRRRRGAPQRRPPPAGKPSLGFLNPLLYANAAALNDVYGLVVGLRLLGRRLAGGGGLGRDPGLGTPNFAALSKIVAALP